MNWNAAQSVGVKLMGLKKCNVHNVIEACLAKREDASCLVSEQGIQGFAYPVHAERALRTQNAWLSCDCVAGMGGVTTRPFGVPVREASAVMY